MSPNKRNLKDAKYGTVFLGRDKATYGEEGTGEIAYDPDFECGGPQGTPNRRCPYKPNHSNENGGISDQERRIHIAIPSFRDPLCPVTLFNMFTKSVRPRLIYVRVIQQNENDDVECLVEYCNLMKEQKGRDDCPHRDQIDIFAVNAHEAYGPTWARSILSSKISEAYENGLVDPQDFCMSTDSHMDFEPDWDAKMVKMWNDSENEYAVLSTYVEDTTNLIRRRNNDQKSIPHLCMIKFTSNVRVHATKAVSNLSKPKLTNAIWGAGLSFSKCHAELKVPVDSHTPGIFDGEEFNRAARFWTYGYDIYTPNYVHVLHNYVESQHNPTGYTWYKNKIKSPHESDRRLLSLIDVPGGYTDPERIMKLKRSKYGLGDRRTLDQLIQFSGIDLRHKKVTIDGKNRCGNIQWVPFPEHPNGVNYIPTFDNNENPILDPDSTSVWYDLSKSNHLTKSKQKPFSTSNSNHTAKVPPKMKHNNLRIYLSEQRQIQRQHGIKYLPPLIQSTVFLLVAGMVIAIISSRKKKKSRMQPKIRSL